MKIETALEMIRQPLQGRSNCVDVPRPAAATAAQGVGALPLYCPPELLFRIDV